MSRNFSSWFERFGRFIFTRIRIPFFLLLLALPPFVTTLFLMQNRSSFSDLQSRFSSAMKKAKTALERKNRKEKFLERHTRPDPYYLDIEIESLSFLEPEKKRLETWLSHPAIPNKDGLNQRLHFLQSEENRLSFIEEEMQISDLCKETIEKQRHPVEMDNDDLKNLLALIEETPLSQTSSKGARPQLVVTDFTLKKTKTDLENEVFEIHLDLLKREFL